MDGNEDRLAPIAGIDLQEFARLTWAIVHGRRRTPEQILAFVESEGHTAAGWFEAHAGWIARFRVSTATAVQYALLFHAQSPSATRIS